MPVAALHLIEGAHIGCGAATENQGFAAGVGEGEGPGQQTERSARGSSGGDDGEHSDLRGAGCHAHRVKMPASGAIGKGARRELPQPMPPQPALRTMGRGDRI